MENLFEIMDFSLLLLDLGSLFGQFFFFIFSLQGVLLENDGFVGDITDHLLLLV